jgi:hypothetical protein
VWLPAALLVATALALAGCKHRRPAHFTWARTPAVGRPSTCPEDAVDFGDGVPTTDQARCSYADGERDLVHVRGKVVQEVRGNIPQGLAAIDVALVPVREDGTDGPALARATTDAQGSFSLKVYARPGKYAIVAADARRFVDVAKKGQRTFDDVQLLVPAD